MANPFSAHISDSLDYFFSLSDPLIPAIQAWMQELGKNREHIVTLTLNTEFRQGTTIDIIFSDMAVSAHWNGRELEEKATLAAETRLVVEAGMQENHNGS